MAKRVLHRAVYRNLSRLRQDLNTARLGIHETDLPIETCASMIKNIDKCIELLSAKNITPNVIREFYEM